MNYLTWPKFKLDRDFMSVLNISKFEQVQIKAEGAMPDTTFPQFMSLRPFCCHGNQRFNPISKKH